MFQKDRYRARIFGVSQLGLVEITRKRARPDVRSVMTRGCPFCGGYGWVLKEDSVAMHIKRFEKSFFLTADAMLPETQSGIAQYIADTTLPFGKKS